MYYKEQVDLIKACYCKACESYFDYDPHSNNTGYVIDGMDSGFCQSCLEKEDPKLLLDITIEFIKDIYVVTPKSFS